VFGEDAARGAIVAQLSGLMGVESAAFLQTVIASAANRSSGMLATALGVVTFLVIASGVFGEIQTALNAIWKAEPRGTTVSRLIRARAASLGLVATLGFVLLVSLVISTLLAAFGSYVNAFLPFGAAILAVLNFLVSFTLIAALFAAIYKVLPDKQLEWRDVVVGAIVTALLFTVGKSLISLYIGSSAVASSYGAAGALMVVLLWIYYSAQIFLLGAELTKEYAATRGSRPHDVPAIGAGAHAPPIGNRAHAPPSGNRARAPAGVDRPVSIWDIAAGAVVAWAILRILRGRTLVS
jgi:membrane protein